MSLFVPMSSWKTFAGRSALAAFTLASLAGIAAGCNSSSGSSSTGGKASPGAPLPSSELDVVRARVKPSTTDLVPKKGHPPLRYVVGIPAVIRINDLNTDRQLLRKAAARNTVIRVDPDKGITFNDALQYPGPLDKTHQYELVLERPQQ